MRQVTIWAHLGAVGLKMDLHLVQASIVVLAATHNPSLLHPSFLANEGIVPKEWEWVPQQSFTTPAVSKVQYVNGLEFIVQPDRLQVVHPGGTVEQIAGSSLPDHIARYLEVLPYVPYTAVGLNFTAVFPQQDAGSFIRDRFLRGEALNLNGRELRSADVKLSYSDGDGRMQVSLADGGAVIDGSAVNGVLIEGNYHRDVAEDERLKTALEHLKLYRALVSDFMRNATEIFERADATQD